MKTRVRFSQICIEERDLTNALWALDTRGRIWELCDGKWELKESPEENHESPEDKKREEKKREDQKSIQEVCDYINS